MTSLVDRLITIHSVSYMPPYLVVKWESNRTTQKVAVMTHDKQVYVDCLKRQNSRHFYFYRAIKINILGGSYRFTLSKIFQKTLRNFLKLCYSDFPKSFTLCYVMEGAMVHLC